MGGSGLASSGSGERPVIDMEKSNGPSVVLHDDTAKGILRLPHRWQRVVHNAGDYSEGQ